MKKEYKTPEISTYTFSCENVLTASGADVPSVPETTVGGNTARSYGAVDVSIFD